MTGYYSVAQFQQAAQRQRRELTDELQRTQHYLHVHRERRAEVGRSYAQAAADLGAAILPRMTREDLARAGALTGYGQLLADDPLGRMQAEARALAERVRAVESDVRFTQRELLRHPATGSLTRAIAECLEYRQPFEAVLARCNHERFARLIETRYGTPEYSVAFWRVSYYQDWKAGDEVLALFPDKRSFAEVRADYEQALASIAPLDAELARLRAEVVACEALEREYAAKRQALESVEGRWLAALRPRIVSFVAECPVQAIAPRFASAPEVELHYKRLSAVAHKMQYLDALAAQQLEPAQRDIQAAVHKLDSDVIKFARPKKAWTQFPADKFERRFRPRHEAYQKRWQRFERSYTTVYAFDRYDAVDLTRDFLWWDIMTDGRLDGRFIPSVSDYYHHHPHYHYERYEPVVHDDMADLTHEAELAHDADAGVASTHDTGSEPLLSSDPS